MLKTYPAKQNNISDIAKINLLCFHGSKNLKESKKWILCNFSAFPRFQYFILEEENKVLGYILWYFKGGWRKESVLELEQIAIHPTYQNKGLGSKLIKESLNLLKKYLREDSRKLKALLVTTGTKQKAQKLYENVLKAKPVAKIKGLFIDDEIILIKKYE